MSQALYEITLNALIDRDEQLTRDEWHTAAARVGRNNEPALLVELCERDLIADDVLPVALASAWSGAEWPFQAVHPDLWVELFHAGGYAVDGEPAPRPAGPVQLYRGADAEHRSGMAWTTDRDRAAWFASRPLWPQPGAVWTTTAPPSALLAYIEAERPGEDEYVVDPEGLGEITEA